jgi:hypothetical protein
MDEENLQFTRQSEEERGRERERDEKNCQTLPTSQYQISCELFSLIRHLKDFFCEFLLTTKIKYELNSTILNEMTFKFVVQRLA